MEHGHDYPDASIIIRTRNEVHAIRECIESVRSQAYAAKIEIVVVDNGSTDGTFELTKSLADEFVLIEDYTPGRALNLGVENSSGEICVFTSAHCIPSDSKWLEKLINPFLDTPQSNKKLAGVYGRQLPDKNSVPIDIKDMWTVFGPEPNIQFLNPFFHNANSAIPKNLLQQYPFDEKATNVEDRIWARLVQSHGYYIYYNPHASVIHSHGINHHNDNQHAEKVISVLRKYKVYE